MEPSIFTKIVNRQIPAAIVYEDEETIAFMDAGQVKPGHVVVAAKKQVETILDLDDRLAEALFRTAAKVAKAIERAFGPEGLTILQANKAAGWQTVPHVHLHVLPRHKGDGVEITWPRKNPSFEELQSMAAKLTVV
ncbi:MAG: HIT family protein [Alphaproteobacteria bacterium]|nr:HIT family protein [Alphaproteobacteria bacterium]